MRRDDRSAGGDGSTLLIHGLGASRTVPHGVICGYESAHLPGKLNYEIPGSRANSSVATRNFSGEL